MDPHPKLHKTQTTARTYTNKLVNKSVKLTRALLGFISLYFYSLLAPFYGNGTNSFYDTTDKPQIHRDKQNSRSSFQAKTKPRKRNSFRRLRHWKMGTHMPWNMSKMLIKVLILTSISLHNIEDLHKTNLNRKLYNLAHNTKFVNQKGNAFPIKLDNMKKTRRGLNKRYKSEHRKRRKLKEQVLHVLNLRFLPQTIRRKITKLAKYLRTLYETIEPQAEGNTAQGPRTYCPICTIPVIGVISYLKQNFNNLTNALSTAATNYFYISQLVKLALNVGLKLTMKMITLLATPFRKMKIGTPGASPRYRKREKKDQNIGQVDGSDDPNDWSSDNDSQNTSTPDLGVQDAEYGWVKKPIPKQPKGIAYWYNPKRPKDKYSEIKNAPKMKPPELPSNRAPMEPETQDDFIEDEEEINITMSETIRTKIVNINVRSAVSDYKKAQIREGIRKINPDVIAITESWLNEYDQEFRIDGYVPIGRQDRPPPRNKAPSNKKRGGGVLVLAKKEVDIQHVHEESLHRNCQLIRFVMDKHTIYVIYRTGKEDVTHRLLTKWLDSEISQLNENPWLITGDLNLGELAKVNFDPKLTPVGTNKQRKTPNHMWTELVKKHRIEQLVDKPTQKTKGNILDYIFVPEHVNVPFIKVDRSAFCTNFDHFAVIFEVDCYYQRTKEEMYKRKETNETWKKFHELLRDIDLMSHLRTLKERLIGQELVNEMSTFIVNTLKETYEKATPLVPVSYTHLTLPTILLV